MKYEGRCAYCGVELPEKGWHADHVAAIQRQYQYVRGIGYVFTGKLWAPENDTRENLVPSCRACNIRKGAANLEDFRNQIAGEVGVCRRNYSAFRHAERFRRVIVAEEPVVFWFEQCQALDDSD